MTRSPADEPGPLAFVTDLHAPELRHDDRHHLQRVLRMHPGDPLTVSDGAGRWRTAIFGPVLEPSGRIEQAPRPTPELAVGFALMKGGRPELVVQKLTELGIDRIVPVAAVRSVVRWDGSRAERSVERLRSVARAAAMQSHRAWLPAVGDLVSVTALLAEPGAALAERHGEPLTAADTTLLIGPEGGWSDDERQLAARRVGLGAHVLRAETAAIVAGALMTAVRAGTLRDRA